jgi:hypothetical protein
MGAALPPDGGTNFLIAQLSTSLGVKLALNPCYNFNNLKNWSIYKVFTRKNF